MLRITAFSADATGYLLKGVGCEDEHAVKQGHEQGQEQGVPGAEHDGAAYMLAASEHGERAGIWHGDGLGMLGVEAGSEASADDVRAIFGDLVDPRTGESLGSRPGNFASYDERLAKALEKEPFASDARVAQIESEVSRSGRRGVAFYDFTFSPSKSASVYYAALLDSGDTDRAAQVLRAHEDAVRTALDNASEHAWVRAGRHGARGDGHTTGRWEKAEGLSSVLFPHSTNRNGEPQLHVHAAVLNRAVTKSDGKIRALDGAAWRPVKEAIATTYERQFEENMRRELGVEWATRADGVAREIVGVDQEVMRDASSRRAEVLARTAELRAQYVEQHGVEPSGRALGRIKREATLETRDRKVEQHQGPGAVRAWATSRREALAGVLRDTAQAARQIAREGHPEARALPTARREVIRAALDEVQAKYPTFTVGHVVAAIDKQVHEVPRGAVDEAGQRLDRMTYVHELAREAITGGNEHGVLTVSVKDAGEVPDVLRRSEDGRPMWRPPIDERYTTAAHLETEQRIVREAAQLGAPAIQGPELELLRVELSASTLTPDQVEAVTGIVSSGRAGDVLIGPAGAGKSFTMGQLAEVWQRQLGGRVIGLAPSQRAADVLVEDGLAGSRNIAKFLADAEFGRASARLQRGDLVIIDEAGMASTEHLDQISTAANRAGAKVLYTGDYEQLRSVGTGGMLELLAKDHGAHELETVRRFRNDWEGEASLRLRDGDVDVLAEYARHGRIHGGTWEELTTQAQRTYVSERLEGRTGLVIVNTNEQAAELSQEIQRDLQERGYVQGEELAELGDRSKVYIGDVVQLRKTTAARDAFEDLVVTTAEGMRVDRPRVANREMGTVTGVDDAGRLLVENERGTLALPEAYVDEHLVLGYAVTKNGAQGATVDGRTSELVDERSSADGVYVGATRSKNGNDILVVTHNAADGHDHLENQVADPVEVLADILTRPQDQDRAATLQQRQAEEISGGLHYLGEQWKTATEDQWLTRAETALTRQLGEETMAKLRDEEAYGALLHELRTADAAGHDVEPLVADMFSNRIRHSRETPDSWGAALHWRAQRYQQEREPERAVDARDWSTLTAAGDGPAADYAQEVADVALARVEELGRDAVVHQPDWAVEQLGELPTHEPDRVEWEDRAGRIAAYRDYAGHDGDGLGPAPRRSDFLGTVLYRAAHEAAGSSAAPLEITTSSDEELRQHLRAFERAQAWAPAHVAEELGQARQLEQGYARDVILARDDAARHEAGTDAHTRALEAMERAQTLADGFAERARLLAEVDDARTAWDRRVDPQRAVAEAAREELTARGAALTVQELSEQPALFDLPEPEEAEHRERPAVDERERDEKARLRPSIDPTAAAHEAATEPERLVAPAHQSAQAEALFELDAEQRAAAGPVREPAATIEPAPVDGPGVPAVPAPSMGDVVGHALRAIATAQERAQAASLAVEAEHARRAEASAVEGGVRSREASRERTLAETIAAWQKARAGQREQAREQERTREHTPALEISGPSSSYQQRLRAERDRGGPGYDGPGFSR
uniref:MobF family relaxase n=1 Tax=Promicromonospora sp. CA-289581 TaxID=3240013 RepID=UPI003F497B02